MLIVNLFVSYVNLCHFFSSFWCQGFAAASACGSFWTFLFTLLTIHSEIIFERNVGLLHKMFHLMSCS